MTTCTTICVEDDTFVEVSVEESEASVSVVDEDHLNVSISAEDSALGIVDAHVEVTVEGDEVVDVTLADENVNLEFDTVEVIHDTVPEWQYRDRIESSEIAGEVIHAFRAVYKGSDGLVYQASSLIQESIVRLIGISSNSALSNGEVRVLRDGEMTDSTFSGLQDGSPLFVGTDGSLSDSPSGLENLCQVGSVLSADRIQVRLSDILIKR